MGKISKTKEVGKDNYFAVYSSETDNFFLPFARLADITFLPFFVAILDLNPCLFFLFLFDGWNVLFIFCASLNR
jgi:hypothetical protein